VNADTEQPFRIVFAGTPEFAAQHLSALLLADRSIVGVFTQPDRPGKRGRKPVASPVKLLCVERDLPLYQPSVIDATAVSELAALQPDLMVVVAYGHKLPKGVLDLPPFGCINVHASLLPRWRGAAPIARAIQAGDDRTGVSIMQMDEGWDSGDIFHTTSCTIADEDTAASLQEKLSILGQSALNHTIDQLQQGSIAAIPQAAKKTSYASKLSKSEAAIDWAKSAEQIQRDIRAYIPNPVAHSFLDSLRVRVWQAEVAEERGADADPGEIIAMNKQGIFVSCGTGTIKLLRVQLPIGKGAILTPRDLLNSRRDLFLPGSRLRSSSVNP
jgi:methionyl-tRNA formyltransferase|tara:strand:- start:5060 stop:6043 length:984 start_codon:yes stop_codon:yes gene_type:complete